MNEQMFWTETHQIFRSVVSSVKNRIYKTDKVWSALIDEGNFDWIEKLAHVEKKTPGFGTIVIPQNGISFNPNTNERVIKWLRKQKVNVLFIHKEIEKLESIKIGGQLVKEYIHSR